MEAIQKIFGEEALTWAQFVEKMKQNPEVQIGQTKPTQEAEQLRAALTNLQAQYQTDLTAAKLDSAVDAALLAAKVRNPKAARALLHFDTLRMENGTVQGLAEQIALLRQNEPYLFENGAGQDEETHIVRTGTAHGAQGTAPMDKFLTAAMAAAGI